MAVSRNQDQLKALQQCLSPHAGARLPAAGALPTGGVSSDASIFDLDYSPEPGEKGSGASAGLVRRPLEVMIPSDQTDQVPDQVQRMLSEHSEKQQAVLDEGTHQLKEVALSLQSAQEEQSARQAREWKELLAEAGERVNQLQLQLKEQAQQMVTQQAHDDSVAEAAAREQERMREVATGARQMLHALRDEVSGVRAAAADSLRATAAALAADAARVARATQTLEAERRAMALARRKALDKLQEASGAVRVLCRCRPPSSAERALESPLCMPSHTAVTLESELGGGARAPPPAEFDFDAALPATSKESELHAEVAPAISSVLQGQYVCVLAYGQTGSGKTYTMQGAAGSAGTVTASGASSGGLVRAAAQQLLEEARHLQAERAAQGHTVSCRFEASMLEIYNDKLVDLLVDEEGNSAPGMGAGTGARPLDVSVDRDGSVSVPGLRTRAFDTSEQISRLLAEGAARRRTHATLMNATSSRSHLVLTLHAWVRSEPEGLEWRGKLHLVDLAGSERIAQSGAVGERLREAQHINKSLSALEQVMLALGQRQQQGQQQGREPAHVPYRNSKLTLLLSDALGAMGSCAKTIMILQVSPAANSAPETLRTLRFGERCHALCLGSVRRATRKTERSERLVESEQRADALAKALEAERERGGYAQSCAHAAEVRAIEAERQLAALRGELERAQVQSQRQTSSQMLSQTFSQTQPLPRNPPQPSPKRVQQGLQPLRISSVRNPMAPAARGGLASPARGGLASPARGRLASPARGRLASPARGGLASPRGGLVSPRGVFSPARAASLGHGALTSRPYESASRAAAAAAASAAAAAASTHVTLDDVEDGAEARDSTEAPQPSESRNGGASSAAAAGGVVDALRSRRKGTRAGASESNTGAEHASDEENQAAQQEAVRAAARAAASPADTVRRSMRLRPKASKSLRGVGELGGGGPARVTPVARVTSSSSRVHPSRQSFSPAHVSRQSFSPPAPKWR